MFVSFDAAKIHTSQSKKQMFFTTLTFY